jgi:hypothetical protein
VSNTMVICLPKTNHTKLSTIKWKLSDLSANNFLDNWNW